MDASVAAFRGFVDYAGLYPPASLDLQTVVRNYGVYRAGAQSWMLGRLIIPIHQLDEAHALAAEGGASVADPWPVSVLVGDAMAATASAVLLTEFRSRPRLALSPRSIETTASTGEEIAHLAHEYPRDLERFIEIPWLEDPSPLLTAIAGAGCDAKIRMGGTAADKFPSTAAVARVLTRASAAGVRLKATAGLHHAVRAERPLTYAEDSPRGIMHGFVNLMFAAALLAAGKIDEDLADSVLDDDRPEVFKFGGRAGSWLNAVLTYGEFAQAREQLLRSIGSCSFEEPVEELRSLGWIG